MEPRIAQNLSDLGNQDQDQQEPCVSEQGSVQQQRPLLQKEGQALHQERQHFREALQHACQESARHQERLSVLRQRIQQSQGAFQAFQQQQTSSEENMETEEFRACFERLREQWYLLRETADYASVQHGFQELRAAYHHLQKRLRQQQYHLHEQCARYQQQLLEYEAQQDLLRAHKVALEQRREQRC